MLKSVLALAARPCLVVVPRLGWITRPFSTPAEKSHAVAVVDPSLTPEDVAMQYMTLGIQAASRAEQCNCFSQALAIYQKQGMDETNEASAAYYMLGYLSSGSAERARCLEKVLAIHGKLGIEDETTATAHCFLGVLIKKKEVRRGHYTKALEIYGRMGAGEGEEVARICKDLSEDVEDGEGKKKLLTKALGIHEKLRLGNAETAKIMCELAALDGEAGLYHRALQIYKKLPSNQEEVAEVYISLSKLAKDDKSKREYCELALKVAQGLKKETAALGAAHYGLGELEAKSGDKEAAREHLETARDVYSRVLGKDHLFAKLAEETIALMR